MKYRAGENRTRTTIYIRPEIKDLLERHYDGNISEFIEEIIVEKFANEEVKLNQIKEYQKKIDLLSDEIMESRVKLIKTKEAEAILIQKKKETTCMICNSDMSSYEDSQKKIVYGFQLCSSCFGMITNKQLIGLKERKMKEGIKNES